MFIILQALLVYHSLLHFGGHHHIWFLSPDWPPGVDGNSRNGDLYMSRKKTLGSWVCGQGRTLAWGASAGISKKSMSALSFFTWSGMWSSSCFRMYVSVWKICVHRYKRRRSPWWEGGRRIHTARRYCGSPRSSDHCSRTRPRPPAETGVLGSLLLKKNHLWIVVLCQGAREKARHVDPPIGRLGQQNLVLFAISEGDLHLGVSLIADPLQLDVALLTVPAWCSPDSP